MGKEHFLRRGRQGALQQSWIHLQAGRLRRRYSTVGHDQLAPRRRAVRTCLCARFRVEQYLRRWRMI